MAESRTGSAVAEPREFELATDRVIELARGLVPGIRARSQTAEALRRLPAETMADVEPLLDVLVPKRWGGQGLGSRALCEVARVLAHGDASSAWAVAFLMEHSWMACHMPWESQEELFADRSFILASAPLAPGGTAERVPGGFRVSGTFRYASCVGNADWTFVTAIAEEDGQPVPYTLLIPLKDVTVNDDWFMSGMAATSSGSVTAERAFVPARMSLTTEEFISTDRHPGAVHEEPFLRYPAIGTIRVMMAGISLGCAEACVDDVRQRLPESKVSGTTSRLGLPLSRVRWGAALEKVRTARLLWTDLLDWTIAKCDAVEPWTDAESGSVELDLTTVVSLSQEAIGMLCDGMGSSVYRQDDPLQRYRRDTDVMASHLFQEWDQLSERATRFILGVGPSPNDPFVTKPPDAGPPAGRTHAG